MKTLVNLQCHKLDISLSPKLEQVIKMERKIALNNQGSLKNQNCTVLVVCNVQGSLYFFDQGPGCSKPD